MQLASVIAMLVLVAGPLSPLTVLAEEATTTPETISVDTCANVPGNQTSTPCEDETCTTGGGTWNGISCDAPAQNGTDGENATSTTPSDEEGFIDTGNGTSTADSSEATNIVNIDLNATSTATTTDETGTSTPPQQQQGSGGNPDDANITIGSAASSTGTTTAGTNTGTNTIISDRGVQRSGNGFARATDRFTINLAFLDSSFGVSYLVNPLEDIVSFVTDLLDFFTARPDAVPDACNGCSGGGDTNVDITQSAEIARAIEAFCNSGRDYGGGIITGHCKSAARAIGVANVVALNSDIMALVLEHDGDLNSDIMLPEPSFFEQLRGGSFAPGTNLTIGQNGTTTLNLVADAETGSSTADHLVISGDALGSAQNVHTLNQINPPTCFVIAVGGSWNGTIHQLPAGFERTDIGSGLTLVCGRGTGEGDVKAYKGIIKQDLNLVMDAVALATTGANDGLAAITGDAIACAHALNMGNIVLTNEDWTLGFFSICGDWNGDLLFGARPGASPVEQAVSNILSGKSGASVSVLNQPEPKITVKKEASILSASVPAKVDYTLTIQNKGGDAQKVVVRDTMTGPAGDIIGEQEWKLGILATDEVVKITYTIEFEGNIDAGYYTNTAILTGERITGNGSPIASVKAKEVVEILTSGEVLGTNACSPLLTEYIKPWKANSPEQVKALQEFLNTYEGEKLAETGFYSSATQAAVKKFQSKYSDDVLAPWGISKPTANVYYTTQKKVNEMVCADMDFSLTNQQKSEIEAFKGKYQAAPEVVEPEVEGVGGVGGRPMTMIPEGAKVVLAELGASKNAEDILKDNPFWGGIMFFFGFLVPFVSAFELEQ